MKNLLKRALPPRLQTYILQAQIWLSSRSEYNADQRRYRRFALAREASFGQFTDIQLEAQLTRDYHRVEKGLALARPKRPFGAELLARLNTLIPIAERRWQENATLNAARSARDALLSWNNGGKPDDAVAPLNQGGSRMSSISDFFTTRHSVRDFSPEPVAESIIQHAVQLAALSPSVCNREPWRLRYYVGASVADVLKHQNGNAGFRDAVPALALISTELGHFAGLGERNQAWIEGGIFASSLMWAFHGLGLDTCMLNLSLPTAKADNLRLAVGMPESEVPIMMLAIGYGRPGHRVARSPRRAINDIVASAQ